MNKKTLEQRIGRYYLKKMYVPRMKKVYYDKGKKHFKGYRISRYQHSRDGILKSGAKIHAVKNQPRLKHPTSWREFEKYYTYHGDVDSPYGFIYAGFLNAHNYMKHL